jgi:hypothetical protein
MKRLWTAITSTLQADATLVSLTEFDRNSNPSIARGDFKANEFKLGLFFLEDPGDPVLANADQSTIRDWDVDFTPIARDEETCADIVTRLTDMFDEGSRGDSGYLDFSNGVIHCCWSAITTQTPIRYEEKKDVYTAILGVNVKWAPL